MARMGKIKRVGRLAGRWALNVLISLDQLGNSILGGDPDETISSRLGRIKQKWGGEIPKTRPVAWATDWVLERIDENHSIEAIEIDEGFDGLRDVPGENSPRSAPGFAGKLRRGKRRHGGE
jgi:hypothetical protein